jgi:hypothetical protein
MIVFIIAPLQTGVASCGWHRRLRSFGGERLQIEVRAVDRRLRGFSVMRRAAIEAN